MLNPMKSPRFRHVFKATENLFEEASIPERISLITVASLEDLHQGLREEVVALLGIRLQKGSWGSLGLRILGDSLFL